MCVFGAQYWYSAGLRSAVTDTASAAHGTHTVCCHTACGTRIDTVAHLPTRCAVLTPRKLLHTM